MSNENKKMKEQEPETTTTSTSGGPSTAQISSKATKYKPPDPRIQPVLPRNKIGRNKPCPCGSGLKFKKCCLNKYKG